MADTPDGRRPRNGGFLGSLKEALAAASRDETGRAIERALALPSPDTIPPVRPPTAEATDLPSDAPATPAAVGAPAATRTDRDAPLSAAEAARDARGVTSLELQDRNMDFDGTNTTRYVRGPRSAEPPGAPADGPGYEPSPPRTQLVRGRQAMKRGQFVSDPVVGWLVVVGGPGLGAYRPVFEGNNTVGRAATNRIALDFGDEAISAEEQAYLRYDSSDRTFLLVPNMSKTNIVSVNNTKPTAAVELKAMDVVTMGRTQLVFMPFCGPDFDWSEISESRD
jgi:hypothetical protein